MSAPPPGPSSGKKGKVKKKVTKKKTAKDEDDTKKDESAPEEPSTSGVGGGDKKDESGNPVTPKPSSAGSSVRDGALRVLTLSLKSEWTAVEGVIKSLEKAVEKVGDETKPQPFAGVSDPVS